MRERLSLRLEEREQELFNLRSSLKQYQAKLKYQIPENNTWQNLKHMKKPEFIKLIQAAGPDFAPIVVEFARLQKEIEGKRWALAELGGAAAPPAL